MFNEVYDQLYKKNPDSLARKVNVAVPDPLHNKVTITENGEQDVVNYAIADIDIEGSGSEGGGGGSPVNPIMTINVVNNTGGGFPISYTDYIDNKLTFVIHPVVESTATISMPWPWFDIVEGYAHDVYILTNFNSETCTITNLVNCFFPFAEDDDYGTVQITDSTLPASFTFTALSLN